MYWRVLKLKQFIKVNKAKNVFNIFSFISFCSLKKNY